MSKLYFRYGTVDSAKTLNLLAVAHKYDSMNRKIRLLKPSVDTRWGVDMVKSRAGLERRVDYIVNSPAALSRYLAHEKHDLECILVDEAQFLERGHINIFRTVVARYNVPVICYGLRCDFRGELFSGSQRLFEVADSIEEIKTTCNFCKFKAIMNLKLIDGVPTVSGPSIELGGTEKFVPACWKCWNQKLPID